MNQTVFTRGVENLQGFCCAQSPAEGAANNKISAAVN
jgi:hypothetical protein